MNLQNSPFSKFFPAGIASQGFLNKETTVWLDSARLYNTCIQPYFSGEVLTQPRHVLNPKIRLQVWKISKSCQNQFLKIIKRIWQTHFWQQWICRIQNLRFSRVQWTPYIRYYWPYCFCCLKWIICIFYTFSHTKLLFFFFK